MLRTEQVQRLHRFAVRIDKAIQHSRMASDDKITVVIGICRNVDALCPLLVGGAEAPIPLEFVQCIGKEPRGTLIAIFVQHGL